MRSDHISTVLTVPLLSISLFLQIGPSSAAPSAALAKKCAVLTAKAFPPRVIGNPAAGSADGSGRAVQEYFSMCLKKGGLVDPQNGGEGRSLQPTPIPDHRPEK
jgi:hypothetical protein